MTSIKKILKASRRLSQIMPQVSQIPLRRTSYLKISALNSAESAFTCLPAGRNQLNTCLLCIRRIRQAGVYSKEGSRDLRQHVLKYSVGRCTVYNSIRELCNNCDAIAIYTPNYARIEIMVEIVDAVKAGAELKGIICEKPLARTVAEAQRLVDLAGEAHLNTSYHENQIHMKSINNALIQLEPIQRTIGPIALARSSEEHSGPHEPWFWDPTRQGGGVLADMGCYRITVSWYVLTPVGKPVNFLEPVSVSCDISPLKWGKPNFRKKLVDKMGVDYHKIPAEDFCTGIITFRNPETSQIVKGRFSNS